MLGFGCGWPLNDGGWGQGCVGGRHKCRPYGRLVIGGLRRCGGVVWASGECESGTCKSGAVPGQRGGDDGVVVGAGCCAISISPVWQALEGVIAQFAEENRIVEEGDFFPFDGEGERFDERGFGFGGGIEGSYGQALLVEGFDVGFADAIGFGPDDLRSPALDDVREARPLEVPAGLVETVEGDHFTIVGVDDCDSGVVVAASPVDAGDISMAGLWLVAGRRGGGLVDVTEDPAVVTEEFGLVFSCPDMIGCQAADAFEFLFFDEFVIGGGKVEGSPFVFFGIEADAIEVPEPVTSAGGAEEEGASARRDEHGSNDLGPGLLIDESGFVEDDEIQAVAAKVIGIVSAANGNHAAVWEINAAFSFAYFQAGQVSEAVFEVAPDLVRHPFGGRQPPAAVSPLEGVDQDGGFAEFGFAPAASAGGYFEAGGVLQDFPLPGVQGVEFDRWGRIRCG